MQLGGIVVANLHDDFNRGGVALRHHIDMSHVANGDAFQGDRRTVLNPRGILKIGAEHELMRKNAAG